MYQATIKVDIDTDDLARASERADDLAAEISQPGNRYGKPKTEVVRQTLHSKRNTRRWTQRTGHSCLSSDTLASPKDAIEEWRPDEEDND